jgi:hypothetical protein
MPHNEQLKIIIDFIEGKISSENFEKKFKTNKDLESLLSDPDLDWKETYIKTNPYNFIQTQDATKLGGALNIQGALEFFLEKKNINCKPTKKYHDLFGIILDSQPKWVNMDTEYFLKHIMPKDHNMKKVELKKFLRDKIKSNFKFIKKPPTWIQSPEWPIVDEKPLVFIGALKVEKCDFFHDDGTIYIFLDEKTENFQTVLQLY